MTLSKVPQRWEIWLARLSFNDKPDVAKHRPVLVLEVVGHDMLAAKITSHIPRDEFGKFAIMQWSEAGLVRPSTVRCSQLFTIPDTNLARDEPFGILQQSDIDVTSELFIAIGTSTTGHDDD